MQLGLNARPIFFIYLFIDDDEFTTLNRFVAVHHVNFFNSIDLVDNALIVGWDNLCTVIPICFVSIILRRIVRSGNDYTGIAAEVANCIGKLRCRA